MVHLVGGLISVALAALFDIVCRTIRKIGFRTAYHVDYEEFDMDVIEIARIVSENNDLITEIRETSEQIIGMMLNRRCTRSHLPYLFEAMESCDTELSTPNSYSCAPPKRNLFT